MPRQGREMPSSLFSRFLGPFPVSGIFYVFCKEHLILLGPTSWPDLSREQVCLLPALEKSAVLENCLKHEMKKSILALYHLCDIR